VGNPLLEFGGNYFDVKKKTPEWGRERLVFGDEHDVHDSARVPGFPVYEGTKIG
jgi:hypothetical protein